MIGASPLLSAAFSFGRLVTKVDLTLGRKSGEVLTMSANNRIVTRDVPKDTRLTQLIDEYNAIAAPLANRAIGIVTADILRASGSTGESPLGDVIADAQLDATDDAGLGDAVVAFMNPGGIRADLTFAGSGSGDGDGNVTYGEAFTVQPFGNSLVTMSLTGAQIEALLEQQFAGCMQQGTTRILQVSAGFTYSWSQSAPACAKVDPNSIFINSTLVNPAASYRVTVNSFLADGGDGFSVLRQGTNRLGGDDDIDALEKHFDAHSPVPPSPANRIVQLP